MTTLEVKQDIIQWVIALKDMDTLKELMTFKKRSLNSTIDWWDELSPSQQASIKRGLEDFKNGRVHTQEEAEAIYGKWL